MNLISAYFHISDLFRFIHYFTFFLILFRLFFRIFFIFFIITFVLFFILSFIIILFLIVIIRLIFRATSVIRSLNITRTLILWKSMNKTVFNGCFFKRLFNWKYECLIRRFFLFTRIMINFNKFKCFLYFNKHLLIPLFVRVML